MSNYPINVVNRLLPSKEQLYRVLSDSDDFGFQLPAYGSKAITIPYLLGIANGEVFAIKKAAYKENHKKIHLTKVDLFVELGKGVQNLGFGIENLPDKRWLKNTLYSVCPNHDFFKNLPKDSIFLNEK